MANYNDVALASANLEIEYLRRQYNDLKKSSTMLNEQRVCYEDKDSLWITFGVSMMCSQFVNAMMTKQCRY